MNEATAEYERDGERKTITIRHPHLPCSDLREKVRETVPAGATVISVQCQTVR